MTYYLIAFFIFSTAGRADFPMPTNLGEFRSKEACIDAAHKVELVIKQKGGAAICVQSK